MLWFGQAPTSEELRKPFAEGIVESAFLDPVIWEVGQFPADDGRRAAGNGVVPVPSCLRRARYGSLLDEEHLPVGRERPDLVGRQDLDLVADFPELAHGRDDLVPHVLRML